MDISIKRGQIHEYIDTADERFLNLVYAMIQADQREEQYKLSAEEIKHLEDRLAAYESNPDDVSGWEDALKRIKK
jgi:cob(I)alamin adenosyltransferase